MAEVNGFVLLVLILLALTTVAGFALFAAVEWGGHEIFGMQTIRLITRKDGVYLIPNGDGTYRVERNEEKETFFTSGRHRKEGMTTGVTATTATTENQTIYVPEKGSALDAFLNDGMDNPFRTCQDTTDCRSLLRTRNDDMIWFMKKVYRDVASEQIENIRKRFEGTNLLDELKVVSENPLTLEMGETKIVVGSVGFPLYYGYVLALLAYRMDDRSLPQVLENEDYVTVTELDEEELIP